MQLKYLTVAGLAPGLVCALSKRTIECSFTTAASKGDTCDGFYKVSSGDHCDTIAETYGITTAQLLSWNSEINDSEKALLAHFFSLTTGGTVIFCY